MNADKFFDSLKGKSVAVVGIGVSNLPLIRLLVKKGASVTAYDKKDDLGETGEELSALGVPFIGGADYLSKVTGDLVIKTPGMRGDKPEFNALRDKGITVTSEMQLFFELCPCRKIAVTGSEGKTTTTTLICELLKMQGYVCHLGGNIGRPLLPDIFDIKPTDFAVVELSSFQLSDMSLSADIAVVKNVTPNHLDWHTSMDEYIDAKKNVFRFQNEDGLLVVNADDDITAPFDCAGKKRSFSYKGKPIVGAFLRGDILCYRDEGGDVTELFSKKDILLRGEHNVDNYLTAIAATWGLVDPSLYQKLAKTFGGVEHRIEFVRKIHGAEIYNDSIATSPTRTVAGLCSFDRKVILIAGGYDKKIPYEPLAPYIVENVKALLLCGATSDKIEAAVRGADGFEECGMQILRFTDFAETVRHAISMAGEGDIVLFSPASASFDMFPNFEAKGRFFKDTVNAYEE